jgi:transposase
MTKGAAPCAVKVARTVLNGGMRKRTARQRALSLPNGNVEMLVAEIGVDMTRFGTVPRLAAWAGVAPGNHASAGKQRSGKTRQGNQTLRAGLTQLAHAAVHTKDTYLAALHRRLAARRGKKRAMRAVAHAIMVSTFYMLARHEPYRELGSNYFDERQRHYTVDRLASRLERLGYRVHLEPVPATAA